MTIEDTTTVAFQDFSVKFKERYKNTPDVYSVYSYDAVRMVYACVLNILQRSEPVTGENIKNELYKIKYDGLCGHYEFDEYGEVSKPFGLFQLIDGQYIRVK
jgi:ABC-type branched-subunit amino acid transport system substrate-binding protein